MLKVGIGQGVLDFVDPKGVTENWYDDTICPMGSRKYNSEVVKGLPPVDVLYQLMIKQGYSGERIIDELLFLYHRYRNFKLDYLADSELMIGIIGYRGTGKSASIVKIACEDFLLAGKRVWSNMPISIEVTYKEAHKKFESETVPKLKFLEGDDSIRDGLLIWDEANLEVAEATRFMAATNLEMAKQLQQIRKKGIDIIWSAQSWNTVDARMRWQSDYIILCSCTKPEHKGILSYWRVMDSTGLSGKLDFELEMRSHYMLDKIVREGNAYIRPWWFAYDTGRLQGQDPYSKKGLEKEEEMARVLKYTTPIQMSPELKLAQQYKDTNGDERIYCQQVFEANEVGNDRARQVAIGVAFHTVGYIKKRHYRYGSYWILGKGNGKDLKVA